MKFIPWIVKQDGRSKWAYGGRSGLLKHRIVLVGSGMILAQSTCNLFILL
jgi:hypothetical protein